MIEPRKNWRIQLRYTDGRILNAAVLSTPTPDFTMPEKDGGNAHFKIMMTLLKGGEDLEILRIIYKQVDKL